MWPEEQSDSRTHTVGGLSKWPYESKTEVSERRLCLSLVISEVLLLVVKIRLQQNEKMSLKMMKSRNPEA